MGKRAVFFSCVVFLAFLIPTSVFSSEKELSSEDLARFVAKAGLAEGKSLDKGLLFFDQDGKKFYLEEYLGEKPLVMGYIFTKCPDVCPNIAASINRAAGAARQRLDDSFNVLVVGLDVPNDTPKSLKEF